MESQGRLREMGGGKAEVEESEEAELESAVTDGGLSGSVAESEAGVAASISAGENHALALEGKSAGGEAKGIVVRGGTGWRRSATVRETDD